MTCFGLGSGSLDERMTCRGRQPIELWLPVCMDRYSVEGERASGSARLCQRGNGDPTGDLRHRWGGSKSLERVDDLDMGREHGLVGEDQ